MEKIVVRDRLVGTCTIEYNKMKNDDETLTEKKQLAIKALAGLQLVCITRSKDNEKTFDRIIGILQDAIQEIEDVTCPKETNDEFYGDYFN